MKTGSKPSVSRSAPKVSRPRTTGVKAKPRTAPTSKPRTASSQPKDKVTLSSKTEAPVRSTTPDPSRMFNEPSDEVGKGSSVHSEHDAKTGEFLWKFHVIPRPGNSPPVPRPIPGASRIRVGPKAIGKSPIGKSKRRERAPASQGICPKVVSRPRLRLEPSRRLKRPVVVVGKQVPDL